MTLAARTLDVTPRSTVSTLQFQNETVNVLVTSLLAVLILTNLGSILSKLVFSSHKDHFSHSSFVRAYIFLNSDDPVRLLSWLRRSNPYTQPTWTRQKNVVRWQRLVFPVTVRIVIFAASMASIAITIPREKRLNFCERADYEPVLDSLRSGAEPDEDGMFRPVCENVRLGTRLGSVRSSVQYCSTQIGSSISQPTLGMTAISVGYRQSGGDLISVVISEGQGFLLSHYVEWRRQQNGPTDEVLRSEFAEWSPKRHIRIVHEAIERVVGKGRCELDLDALQEIPVAGIDAVAAFMTCTVNTVEVQRYVSGYMRSALQWNRSNKVVSRINASGESVKLSSSDQCPIEVTVTRPVVNIVPLAVIMMLMFTINIATGITVARHGDVLDAAFHLVKEVMGYDCTSNPLEECIGDGKREAGGGGVELAEIRRYECADGVGRHVGFLRGDGCKVIGVGIDDDGDAANGPRGDSFGGGVVCRCRWADGSGRRWAEPAFPFDDAV